MSHEEENVLRYVAGYIIHKVKVQLESSKNPHKDDMIVCLIDMSGYEMNEGGTEDWINSIDRGGLWHINDQTYSLFYAIEEVRKYFQPECASKLQNSKKEITETILQSVDVQFHWSMLSVDVDEAVGSQLLHMIITLYTTVRGFSFARSMCRSVQTSL